MSYEREPVLAWLEEDNAQRSYFRLLPLLTPSGLMREEAMRLWPEDGALRIVPDRNEQGYFKDRMRAMGNFCLMNISAFPPDASKIRTNKNYRPEREERNRYIIYSDAVMALPPHTFLEVLIGHPEDAPALSEQAATPMFVILDDDTFYGPVDRLAPAVPQPMREMTATAYVCPCPDGKERTFLCTEAPAQEAPAAEPAKPQAVPVKAAEPAKPQAAPAKAAEPAKAPAEPAPAASPAAAKKPESTVLPIGQSLQILDAGKNFEETLDDLSAPVSGDANLLKTASAAPVQPDAPAEAPVFSGTPLRRATNVYTSTPRPGNRTQEAVNNQLHTARNDPPAQPLPAGAVLRQVENPVEAACRSLGRAWNLQDARRQLLDYMLSLPGISHYLNAAGDRATPLERAMLRRLDDIEADRLCAMIELGHLQGDIEEARKKVLESAKREARRQLADIEARSERAQADFESTREQLTLLQTQSDALHAEIARLQSVELPQAAAELLARAQLTAPSSGTQLPLSGRIGREISDEELIALVQEAFRLSDRECDRNTAVALLALAVSCRTVGVACATTAPVLTLLENLCTRLGWRSGLAVSTRADDRPVITVTESDTTPMFIVSTLPVKPVPGAVTVQLTPDARIQQQSPLYGLSQWPILQLKPLPLVCAVGPEHEGAPTALSIGRGVEKDRSVLDVLAPVMAQLPTLSGAAADELCRFTAIAASLMDGGLRSACDWAIRLWLLPLVQQTRRFNQVQPLLQEYPMTSALVSGPAHPASAAPAE